MRIRRPDAEDSTLRSCRLDLVRPQFVVDAIVAAFIEEIEIFGRQKGDVIAHQRSVGGSLARAGLARRC